MKARIRHLYGNAYAAEICKSVDEGWLGVGRMNTYPRKSASFRFAITTEKDALNRLIYLGFSFKDIAFVDHE